MANAINAVTNGPGQLTEGLTWNPDTGWSVSGLGLVTFGFLWLRNDIWVDCAPCEDVTWTDCDCCENCS
jgi:hypothetical protein